MQDNQMQTQWAYIAGIMDADGCFMIMKNNNKGSKRKNVQYIPGVKIAMIEIEAISFITCEMKLGNYRLTGARKDRPKSKPIFDWWLRCKGNLIPFLENIIPYLRVKKERAKFLLEFCKKQKNCFHNRGGLSINELDYRESSYWKMREMNGNKVAATTKPSDIRKDEAIV